MALYPCPECDNQISEKAEQCPHCGAKWAGLCPECGAFRDPSANSCTSCGFPFAAPEQAPPQLPPFIESASKTVEKTEKQLGNRWFLFWTYIAYPLSAFMMFTLAVGTGKPYWAILGAVFVAITYGLHKKQLWAWQANWVVLVGNLAIQFLPAYKELLPADQWLIELIAYGVFLALSALYWEKRRSWFKHSPGQMLIWTDKSANASEGESPRDAKMRELSRKAKGQADLNKK